MKKYVKLFTNQRMKSFDEENRTVEFIISDNSKDRYGDRVEQDWNLKNYWNNPILLWGHDPSQINHVIGKCLEINTDEDEDGRSYTSAKFQFAEEGTSEGVDTVFKLVKQGILRTVSVGFLSNQMNYEKDEDDEYVSLKDNELLEVSIVPIPANPNALALSYEDGTLDHKDMKFIEKQLEQSLDLVKKSVYDKIKLKNNSKTNNQKEFQMTDEDIKKIVEALMEELPSKIAEALSQEKAPKDEDEEAPKDEETNTSKPDEEAPKEETPEEEQPSDEDEEDKKPKAKSKQNDDDGAFDENEELNEEQEKAFREELEAEYQKQLK